MKITIDTIQKTVKPVSQFNIKEFYEFIQKTLPNWEEYSFSNEAPNNWTYYPHINTPFTYTADTILTIVNTEN